ncbi:MAG: RNA-guided pseudouridylation complex pseudouridine synthase subunit Cbf5 [Nanoarchaeota archaeon]
MTFIELRKDKPSGFGKNPNDRTALELLQYGIVIIDKPSGPTSHQVSAYVKGMLHLKKTGHSGTLDPKVTGVLPVALGRGTRIVSALLPQGKEYIALMHLHADVPRGTLIKAFNDYIGKIKQMPPVKSAVKRQWRERSIYELELIDIVGQDALFRTSVEAGTYIRKLIHDLGQTLGCGAHMAELRRTRAGPFTEDQSHAMQDLADAYYYFKQEKKDEPLKKLILPVETAVVNMQKVWVLDSTVDSLCHGATLKLPGIAKITDKIAFDTPIAVMTLKEELIGLGKAKMSTTDMQKYPTGVAVKLEHVFMMPGTYPKMDKQ